MTLHDLDALPVHPVTGLTALGLRRNGAPIWPVLGGDGTGDDQDDGTGDDQGGDGKPDAGASGGDDSGADAGDGEGSDDALGEQGKRALDAWKARARRAEEQLAEAGISTKSQARKAQLAETDRSRKAAEPEPSEAQNAVVAATAATNKRILRSEIRAAAAGQLADPKDALTFLDLEQFEVDADGDVDASKIQEAIDDLLKNKPYLAAATAKRFQGTGDNGAASRKASKPKQLTETDLKSMTADEIVKAQDEGRCNDLLGIT